MTKQNPDTNPQKNEPQKQRPRPDEEKEGRREGKHGSSNEGNCG